MQPGPYSSNDNYTMGGDPYGGQPPASSGPLGPILDLLRNNIKTLIILIIVGAAGFYAYDYFIGSQVNVTIQITDLQGESVPNVSGYLETASGDRVDKSGFSGNEKRITLRRGEYAIRAQAEGYQIVNGGNITVDTAADAPKTFKVTMAKQTSISFRASNTFPEKILEGQELTVPIAFDNSGKTETLEVEITTSPKINGLSIEMAPASMVVSSAGAEAVLLVTAAPSLTVDSKGQNVVVTLTIKGTQKKESFTLNVRKRPSFQVTPTNLTLTTTAGKPILGKTITITNNDKVEYVFEPEMVIEVTESNNSAESIPEWFSVVNVSPSSGTLRTSSPDNKAIITFEVRPPASAIADQISGVIRISTDYWNTAIPFGLSITAAKNLINVAISPSNFTIRREGSVFENKNAILSLTNSTTFDIENIQITLDDPAGCSSYIKFDEAGVVILPKDATSGQNKKDIQVTITAPASAKVDQVKACNILVTYDDPTNPGSKISPAISKLVQITPVEA